MCPFNLSSSVLIGKNGTPLQELQTTTGATVKLSHANDFFPGTTERTVVVSGPSASLMAAQQVIVEKVYTVRAWNTLRFIAQFSF